MLNDGSNTASTTRATTPERTTTSEVDRLKDLKYDVVVQQENGCTTIKIELKVDFDFDTGTIGGKDIVAVQTELKNQIEALEGKNGKA
jgi:hypothetical protein